MLSLLATMILACDITCTHTDKNIHTLVHAFPKVSQQDFTASKNNIRAPKTKAAEATKQSQVIGSSDRA